MLRTESRARPHKLKERRNAIMSRTDEKTENKFNLPALKMTGAGVAKKPEAKALKTFNVDAIKKQCKVNDILKKDSIKQQMHREQQMRKGLDLVLIGDFTDSMSLYRDTLRKKFKELCATLIKIIPNLRIGIVFYLDHGGIHSGCYNPNYNPYVTKVHKLSVDIESLSNFIDSTPIGNGLDWDEAVEDALFEAQNLNWSEINTRSIVLFGDARPHEPEECDKGYDYFKLTESLFNHNTTINTVYCSKKYDYRRISSLYEVDIGDFSHRVSNLADAEFFSWIANVTGGVAIGVEQIDDIVDIIKAMAAKDAGKIDELEKEELKISSRPLPALVHIKERAKFIETKKKLLMIGNA